MAFRGGVGFWSKVPASARQPTEAPPRESSTYSLNLPEMKLCTRCNQTKPLEQFYAASSGRRGSVRTPCISCIATQSKSWAKTNTRRTVSKHLKSRYGISIDEFEALSKSQHDVCAICKRPCSSKQRLSVDHNHQTGQVRGLLCANCNHGLGHFMDSPELLRKAAIYLKTSELEVENAHS